MNGAGAMAYPAYGWLLSASRSRAAIPSAGNTMAINYIDGLQTSKLVMRLMPSLGLESALSVTGFIPYFTAKSLAASGAISVNAPLVNIFDTYMFTLYVSDGNSQYKMIAAKPESCTIRIQKGLPVSLDLTWVSPCLPIRTDAKASSLHALYNQGMNQNFGLLMYKNVSFNTGPLSGLTSTSAFHSMETTYRNNHKLWAPANGSFDGAIAAGYAYVSGSPSGEIGYTVKAYSGSGFDPQLIADGEALQMYVDLGSSQYSLFTYPSVLMNTDLDGSVLQNTSASMRSIRNMLKGTYYGGVFWNPFTMGSYGQFSFL